MNFINLIGIITSHWPCVGIATVIILCLFRSPYYSFYEETHKSIKSFHLNKLKRKLIESPLVYVLNTWKRLEQDNKRWSFISTNDSWDPTTIHIYSLLQHRSNQHQSRWHKKRTGNAHIQCSPATQGAGSINEYNGQIEWTYSVHSSLKCNCKVALWHG